MKLRPNHLLHEIIWIAAVSLAAMLPYLVILGWKGRDFTFDIHLHDTYFVISPAIFLLPAILTFVFVVFYIKEWRHHFMNNVPNIIIILAGLAIVCYAMLMYRKLLVSGLGISGWTAYPPLSTLGNSSDEISIGFNPLASAFGNISLVCQLVITILLFYLCFRWGRSKMI